MSTKFQTLCTLSRALPVPPLVGLSEGDLRQLWSNLDDVRLRAQDVLRDIKVTAGAFLDEHLARIPRHSDLKWRPDADQELAKRLLPAGLTADEMLAVRSSADVEDGARQSFAGIFTSHLRVSGMAALKAALADVWLSTFSRAAVLERLRLGHAIQDIGMTIIVQRMVYARWAGVAFSHDPVTGSYQQVIEAVPGLADGLVGGTDRAITARVRDGQQHCEPALQGQQQLVGEVAALARQVSRQFGGPADIEWVADADLVWLVQARPVTSLLNSLDGAGPVLEWTDLYAASDESLAPYRPLPGFAQYFRSKRAPLARFASRHGVSAGKALLIRANLAGLNDPGPADTLAAHMTSDSIVLDLSDDVRQQVLPRSAWLARAAELSGDAPTNFVVREFIVGDAGLITQALPGGRVICEYSPEGLMAINRGTAATTSFLLSDDDTPRHDAIAPDLLLQLLKITQDAQAEFGPIQLEWVVQAGDLRLIDFSPVRAALASAGNDEQRTISPGYAEGDCIRVVADRALHEVSISARVSIDSIPDAESLGPAIADLVSRLKGLTDKPVVVSPRPYAALAAVLPYVKGFVFEQASMLCHLSILLREHGVPAVESRELYCTALTSSRIAFSAAV